MTYLLAATHAAHLMLCAAACISRLRELVEVHRKLSMYKGTYEQHECCRQQQLHSCSGGHGMDQWQLTTC
jgi:hypothetical protein